MCFVLNGCPKEQHILVNWTADRPDLCTKSTKFPLGDYWKSAVPIRNVQSVTQASACISKTLGRRVHLPRQYPTRKHERKAIPPQTPKHRPSIVGAQHGCAQFARTASASGLYLCPSLLLGPWKVCELGSSRLPIDRFSASCRTRTAKRVEYLQRTP